MTDFRNKQHQQLHNKRLSAKNIKGLLENSTQLIGKNISVFRKEKQWSQVELAYHACTDQGLISKIESGDNYNPELLTLAKIAFVLGVELTDLFRAPQAA